MFNAYANGQTSVVLRPKLRKLDTSQGFTGLTISSAGLIISTIADNEATPTVYTQAGSTVETVTTLGTYAAPTATKCRFREVDATNHPGAYEIQIADARFAVAGAKALRITISGVTNLAECDLLIPLQSVNPYDAVRNGMTALPNTACTTNASLLTSGTGTDQVSVSAGKVLLQATQSGVTIPTVTTVGTLTTYTGNTPQTGDAYARLGAPAGASTAADIAAVNAKTTNLPAAPASTTNITAGTITTVTNLTNSPTAGDFTATMKTSIGTAVAASAVASVTAGVTLAASQPNYAPATAGAAMTLTTGERTTLAAMTYTAGVTLAASQPNYAPATAAALAALVTTVGVAGAGLAVASVTGDVGGKVLGGGSGTITGVGTRADVWKSLGADVTNNDGTAQAGASGSITLAAGAPAVSLAGWGVYLNTGTGAQQFAIITAYNTTTKVATIRGTWPVTPDATTTYTLYPPVPASLEFWLGTAPNALVTGKVDASATVSLGTNAPAGWINAAAVAASALNGKGDWSTYAGGDTSGTTTLLSRITASVALASQIPANFTAALFASAGVFSVGALVNAPAGGGGGGSVTVAGYAAGQDPATLVWAAGTRTLSAFAFGVTLAASQPNYAPATAAALAALVTTVGVAGAGLTVAAVAGDVGGKVLGGGASSITGVGVNANVVQSLNVAVTNNDGTAQAGASGSITLAAGAPASSLVGWSIYLNTGTGALQSAVITAYNTTTKVATISPTWATTPDATTTYTLTPPVALAASQPNYAPSKAGDAMTLTSAYDAAKTAANASQIPANFTAGLFVSPGVFSSGALVNAPAGGGGGGSVVVAGYATGQDPSTLVWAAGTRTLTAPVTVGTNNDKGGYGLAASGLDAISVAAPTGSTFTFPQMNVKLFRRTFKKTVKAASDHTIKDFADDGTSVLTTQTWTDDGQGNESLGDAT